MREKKGGALQKLKKRLSHSFGRLCKYNYRPLLLLRRGCGWGKQNKTQFFRGAFFLVWLCSFLFHSIDLPFPFYGRSIEYK